MNLAVAVGKSDHAQGPEDAPVTVVEYGDYQCPYCADMNPMIKAIAEAMGTQLRFVFRAHAIARDASLCAARRGSGRGGRRPGKILGDARCDLQQQSELGSDLLHQLALRFKLDVGQFSADLETRRYRPRVKRDFMGGMRSGVAGTPTFFINGKRYEGALDHASLLSAIGRA